MIQLAARFCQWLPSVPNFDMRFGNTMACIVELSSLVLQKALAGALTCLQKH